MQNLLVTIFHTGVGDEVKGQNLAEKMVSDVQAKCTGRGGVVVFHDARGLQKADEKYAIAFGRAFKFLRGYSVQHVALIDKSLWRVLARFAARFGGIEMTIARTEAEAKELLGERLATAA